MAAGWGSLSGGLVSDAGGARKEAALREEGAAAEAARGASLLKGEASMQLLPSCRTLLRDEK